VGPGVPAQDGTPAPGAAPATAVVSGVTFPIGMLVYFGCANTLSLVQQLAVIRWLPIPGSPAAAQR